MSLGPASSRTKMLTIDTTPMTPSVMAIPATPPSSAVNHGSRGRPASHVARAATNAAGAEDHEVRRQRQEAQHLDALIPHAGERLLADPTDAFELESDEPDRAAEQQPAGDGQPADEVGAGFGGQLGWFSPRHTASA